MNGMSQNKLRENGAILCDNITTLFEWMHTSNCFWASLGYSF